MSFKDVVKWVDGWMVSKGKEFFDKESVLCLKDALEQFMATEMISINKL